MHLRQERGMLQVRGKVRVERMSDILADATKLDVRDMLSEAYATAKRALRGPATAARSDGSA